MMRIVYFIVFYCTLLYCLRVYWTLLIWCNPAVFSLLSLKQ